MFTSEKSSWQQVLCRKYLYKNQYLGLKHQYHVPTAILVSYWMYAYYMYIIHCAWQPKILGWILYFQSTEPEGVVRSTRFVCVYVLVSMCANRLTQKAA